MNWKIIFKQEKMLWRKVYALNPSVEVTGKDTLQQQAQEVQMEYLNSDLLNSAKKKNHFLIKKTKQNEA